MKSPPLLKHKIVIFVWTAFALLCCVILPSLILHDMIMLQSKSKPLCFRNITISIFCVQIALVLFKLFKIIDHRSKMEIQIEIKHVYRIAFSSSLNSNISCTIDARRSIIWVCIFSRFECKNLSNDYLIIGPLSLDYPIEIVWAHITFDHINNIHFDTKIMNIIKSRKTYWRWEESDFDSRLVVVH